MIEALYMCALGSAWFSRRFGFRVAFEFTPEGIVRTENLPPNGSMAQHTGRKLHRSIITLACGRARLFLFQQFRSAPLPAPSAFVARFRQKSIAVLLSRT